MDITKLWWIVRILSTNGCVHLCLYDVGLLGGLWNIQIQVVNYTPLQVTEQSRSAFEQRAAGTARRHENFLKRDAPGGAKKPSSWRPRTMYRATSTKVLQMIDNQVALLAIPVCRLPST